MIRLGVNNKGENIFLDFFLAQHTLLTGQTRSGKSICLYSILAQLKDEPNIKVCGIDPTSILFNAIGEHLGGSDLRVGGLKDCEKACEVVKNIVAEMDRRIDLLLSQSLDKFDREHFNENMPLLVVCFEEFPGIQAILQAFDKASGAKPAERTETRFKADLQRLALEGAKVGIRLLIVAQRADTAILTGILRSQLTQRISFRQDKDGLRMLHETITPEQIEAMPSYQPGMALCEFDGFLPLQKIKADFISYQELVRHYKQVEGLKQLSN